MGKQVWKVTRSTVFSRTFQWKLKSGAAVPVGTRALEVWMRLPGAEILKFPCTVVNSEDGIFRFSLTALQTASLPTPRGFYAYLMEILADGPREVTRFEVFVRELGA